jgi:hypothetical protein
MSDRGLTMKTIKQIDIWLQNRPGALCSVTDLLGTSGITIMAFHVAGDVEEGELHIVVNDPGKAVDVLKAAGYEVEVKDVIACEMPDKPNSLKMILNPLSDANINVDYIYPGILTGDTTVLILSVGPVEEALKIMEENRIRIQGHGLSHV